MQKIIYFWTYFGYVNDPIEKHFRRNFLQQKQRDKKHFHLFRRSSISHKPLVLVLPHADCNTINKQINWLIRNIIQSLLTMFLLVQNMIFHFSTSTLYNLIGNVWKNHFRFKSNKSTWCAFMQCLRTTYWTIYTNDRHQTIQQPKYFLVLYIDWHYIKHRSFVFQSTNCNQLISTSQDKWSTTKPQKSSHVLLSRVSCCHLNIYAATHIYPFGQFKLKLREEFVLLDQDWFVYVFRYAHVFHT